MALASRVAHRGFARRLRVNDSFGRQSAFVVGLSTMSSAHVGRVCKNRVRQQDVMADCEMKRRGCVGYVVPLMKRFICCCGLDLGSRRERRL